MKALKTNQEITAAEVFLIDENGVTLGKVSLDQALYLAYQADADLVMIGETQTPPIVKIMDYGKYLYSQQKQLAKQKAHSHETTIKEIRMGLKIGDHDLAVKIGRIKRFFEEGDKVKVTIQLRGREMMFQNRVQALLDKIRVESGAELEKPLERMGNRFNIVLTKAKA